MEPRVVVNLLKNSYQGFAFFTRNAKVTVYTLGGDIDSFSVQISQKFFVQTWSIEVLGDNGTFAGGKALSISYSIACGSLYCGEDVQERMIQLRGGKR